MRSLGRRLEKKSPEIELQKPGIRNEGPSRNSSGNLGGAASQTSTARGEEGGKKLLDVEDENSSNRKNEGDYPRPL